MIARWLWLDHVPPALALNEQERRQVLGLARHHRDTRPLLRTGNLKQRILTGTMCAAIVVAFIAWIVWLPRLQMSTTAALITNLCSILVFNLLLWSCIAWSIYRTNVPYVRWALAEIGKPVCMRCGYILVGGVGDGRCPECGERRLSHTQPRLSEPERSDAVTIDVMQKMGFDVCTSCGCLWAAAASLQTCPQCKQRLATAPPR